MNKKGFELTISTIVIMVIGIAVLIGLVFMLKGGFEDFEKGTTPFFETTEGLAIRESCELSCSADDKLRYCCKEFDYEEEQISCKDSRLEIGCYLDCEGFACEE